MNQILKVGISLSIAAAALFTVYSLGKKIIAEREEIYLDILKES